DMGQLEAEQCMRALASKEGIFCGGPYWKGTWRAVKDPDVSLPDATQLTYLKSGYESIDFSFPDLLGQMVSPEDEKYNNKALIIQIIGSWCPNCMDETRYFAELYRKYKTKGLEIIALCYESDDFEASKRAIFRFKNDLNAAYTFLHAGESNKNKASQTLPMINRVISYPTSIFINKEGEIQKIFTGFTGPGTGKHFDNLASEMTSLIESML
ncbi:MAG: redoxin family protein, partial [Bacteroidetes bacterium]|nr:redoxin family protein [Bacteroidota bacterium]